jgi:hypothetical protein
MIGLVSAADAYNPAREAFDHFAYFLVHGPILFRSSWYTRYSVDPQSAD